MSEVRLLYRVFFAEQVGELASKKKQQAGGVVSNHISFKRNSWNCLT
jgi:hypothetical protein